MVNEFKLKYKKIIIDVQLPCGRNIVIGDSATGKSYMISVIRAIKADPVNMHNAKCNIDLNRVAVCSTREEIESLYKLSNHLIFIDRLDIIAVDPLTKKINERFIKFINNSNNIFVLMDRGTIGGIITTREGILKLTYSVNGDNIVLKSQPC